MPWSIIDICVFLLNAIITGIVIPKILLIAFRKKLFDEPDERKIHHSAVPRLGGIAFCPVVIFSLSMFVGVAALFDKVGVLTRFYPYLTEVSMLTSSCILLYLVGMCDDLIGVKYKAKFFAQIMCGILLVISDLWISDLHDFLWISGIPMWLGVPITILLVVFIINSINLIDGIDGLASGLCGVALLYYGIVFCLNGNLVYSMIAVATLGTLVPFFLYNVFGKAENGSKIFMGDTGALTVGIVLCFMSMKLGTSSMVKVMPACNPLVVAFAPLMIPCLDVIRVFGNRLMRHKNPFLPDKTHIHHKFLAAGMSQQYALIIILLISAFCAVCAVLLSKILNVTFVLLICVLFYCLLNYGLNKIDKRNKEKQINVV